MNFNIGAADGYVMDPDIADMDKKLKAEGKTGIVYDPSVQAESTVNPIENLPDTENILTNVEEILKQMCEDEVVKLRKENEPEYITYMESKFPAFSFRYYALFQTIIEGKDLTPLFGMLGAIERVKKGDSSLDQEEKDLGEELAEEYVYPFVNKNTEGNDSNKNTDQQKKKNKKQKRK